MKKIALIIGISALGFSCTSAPRPVATNGSTATAPAANEKPQTAIAHTTENQKPGQAAPSGDKSKWAQGGDPIETRKFDTAIAAAEKALVTKPSDEAAKKALGTAYYERGVALTDARQYASALGDYRRAIKYDPSNADAKGWIDKIVMIYDSMNKAYPKEGEEPPPLPSDKAK